MTLYELLTQLKDKPTKEVLTTIYNHHDCTADIKSKVKLATTVSSGWLFVGADFSSLEDKINALLTKDTNKLKVYQDKYDGHCLRAYSYWGNNMPLIKQAEDNVQSYEINGVTFTALDVIEYQGITYTGEELYNKYSNL
jgi:hypothetical protein